MLSPIALCSNRNNVASLLGTFLSSKDCVSSQGHLYSGDTSIQGTPPFRGHLYSGDTSIQGTQNLVRENVHIIFVSVTSIEGTVSLGPEAQF